MPTIVQMEVVHYLVRRLGPAAAIAIDTFLAQGAEVEALTGGVTTEAARLLLDEHASGIGGRDACILVMAKRREATLLTNDKMLAKVARSMGIKVVNPTTALAPPCYGRGTMVGFTWGDLLAGSLRGRRG